MILNFLLYVVTASAREEDQSNHLPIHHAIRVKSFPFCKTLLDAYPESVGIGEWESLPIHYAFSLKAGTNITDIIRYLLELYPQSINVRQGGELPIHIAASKGNVEVIKLLLQYDPEAATKKTTVTEWNHTSNLPFHVALKKSSYDAAKLLYDIYPEAIVLARTQTILGEIYRRSLTYTGRPNYVAIRIYELERKAKILAFIDFFQEQLDYAKKVRDLNQVHTWLASSSSCTEK